MFVVYGDIKDNVAQITKTFDQVTPSVIEANPNGFEIDTLPEADRIEGMYGLLKVKFGDGEKTLYYDYFANPPMPETEIDRLRKEIETLRAADLDNKEMINGLGEMLMALMEG